MLSVGAFPMPPVSVYIRPTGIGCSRSVNAIMKAADDEIIGLILLVMRTAVRL